MMKKIEKFLLLSGSVALINVTSFGKNKEVSTSNNYAQLLHQSVENLKQAELAKVFKEATAVIWQTQTALTLLKKGDIEKAITQLGKIKATLQKLSQIYKLNRIPADVEFMEYSANLDLKTAEQLNQQVKNLVSNNRFVSARFILNTLRDEIDVITTYLPIDLYSRAIDFAIKLLKSGKVKPAIYVVESALSTLEVETTIVPKPILFAQRLIESAKKIYQTDPKTALELIEKAEYEIKLAKALGYISSEEDLKPLYEAIAKLKLAVKNQSANTAEQFQNVQKLLKEEKQKNTVTQ